MSYTILSNALRSSLPLLNIDALRAPSEGAYSHVPLNKDRRSLRLAFLYPGLPTHPLRCSFAELPLEAVPDYWALSYTWGAPTIVSEVWIGNQPLGITKNLECALKRLRHKRLFRPVWIDALCINQTDDGEKSRQVLLMRDIYETATRVIIYLGEDEDGSSQIPGTCTKILEAVAKFTSLAGSEHLATHQLIIPRANYASLGLPEIHSPVWEAFRKLLSRPWFLRVWIIQEAVVCKSAEVICGSWKLDWKLFITSFELAIAADMPILGGGGPSRASAGRLLFFMKVLGSGEPKFTPWKLIHLLHRCRIANATNPKDYVFGLLGLSIEAQEPTLLPNYSESVQQVYCRYASYLIEQGDGIAVLYNSCSAMHGLPSWVPNWSDRYLPQPRLCPEPHAKYEKKLAYSAASALESSIRLHPSAKEILVVKGVRVDTIESMGTFHTLAGISLDEDTVLRYANYGDGSALENTKTLILLINCVIEARRMLDERFTAGEAKYPTSEDIYTVIWRLLICNLGNRSVSAASPEYVKFYRAFEIAASADAEERGQSWPIAALTPAEKSGGSLAHEASVFIQGASEFCVTRRRCVCRKSGYIGQVPLNTCVRDEIFIPLGSAIPFIIRPQTSSIGKFQLIGECYIHGIMNGEVLKRDGYESVEALIV
jgi:hypothetical protein